LFFKPYRNGYIWKTKLDRRMHTM